MRAMLVLEAAGGGAGRHVLDLIGGLLQRNHSVALAYSADRAEAAFESRLASLPGVEVHRIPMRREVGVHDFRDALALRALIRQTGPYDVLHAHSSKAGALLRLAQMPDPSSCIYTPHALITLNPELGSRGRLIYGTFERFLARFCAGIICVSEHERQHALGLGIPESKLTVVHNGIDAMPEYDREAVRAELGIVGQTVCVGAVGRLSHQKSLDRLIAAFARCRQLAGNCGRLVIVGDGPEREPLEHLVKHHGLRDHVLFTGNQDGPRLMAAFDIFALSSRYEALPYVLLEATVQGLPVVMTDTGGAGSVVRNEINGFVVAQETVEDFALRLAELMDQPERRGSYGEKSKQIAAEFDLDHMVEATLGVYARVIQGAALG